jgi:hypothetical protein
VSAWLLSLTGEWGPPLLAWYQANSWVNLLFVAYGVVVLLAWRNYDHVQQQAIAALLAGAKPGEDGRLVLPQTLRLNWSAAVAGLRFPWLTRRGHLRLHACTAENAERLLDPRQTRLAAERTLERMQRKLS